LCDAQDISVLVTFVIAEAVGAVAHAAEEDHSAAVAALCDSLASRLCVGLLVLIRRRAEGLAHAPGLLAVIRALDVLLGAPPFPWSGSGEGELVSGVAQSRLGVLEGRNASSAGVRGEQLTTTTQVGQTSGLPVRASSGCPFLKTSETRGFTTGRPEVCPTGCTTPPRPAVVVVVSRYARVRTAILFMDQIGTPGEGVTEPK
jgi:hypothetical protein